MDIKNRKNISWVEKNSVLTLHYEKTEAGKLEFWFTHKTEENTIFEEKDRYPSALTALMSYFEYICGVCPKDIIKHYGRDITYTLSKYNAIKVKLVKDDGLYSNGVPQFGFRGEWYLSNRLPRAISMYLKEAEKAETV